MIVVANRITVAPGSEAAFEERFRQRQSKLRQVRGFVRNELLRPINGDCYIVMTHWVGRGAFEAWKESEAFKQAHANPPPSGMFAAPSVLEIHEVVLSEETQ